MYPCTYDHTKYLCTFRYFFIANVVPKFPIKTPLKQISKQYGSSIRNASNPVGVMLVSYDGSNIDRLHCRCSWAAHFTREVGGGRCWQWAGRVYPLS